MADKAYLDWPFFDGRHVDLEEALDGWAAAHVRDLHGTDVDADCRRLVRMLGEGGWLRHAIGGAGAPIDTRALCLIRETLARHNGLADFAFAMQGLGSGALSLFGTAAQRERYLPRVARGEAIAAFALSEPDAGSDVAALRCTARLEGDAYVLDGEIMFGQVGTKAVAGELAVLGAGTSIVAATETGGRFLLCAGTPIREPVARRGPFVMNTDDELRQAFADYQSGTLTL